MRPMACALFLPLIWTNLITVSALVAPPKLARTTRNQLFRDVSKPPSRSLQQDPPALFMTATSPKLEKTNISISSSTAAPSVASEEASKKRFTTSLALLTGCADIFLIRKYGTFCTMMTGNLMWMCRALTEANFGRVGYYATVIAAYIVGLVAFRKAELTWEKRSVSSSCAPLILTLFLIADAISLRFPRSHLASATLLSFAYGIINSIGTEIAGTLVFVVTGHMTKLTRIYTNRLSRQAGKVTLQEKDKAAALQSLLVIGGFALGALGGCFALNTFPAILTKWGGFSLLGALYGMLFMWQDRKHLWTGPESDSQAFSENVR